MLNDKNIKDLFNNSSLEDQSWLEPSDSVFSGIEDAIYNDEDEEKKPFLLWFIGAALLLCSMGIVTWTLNTDDPKLKPESSLAQNYKYSQESIVLENNESKFNSQVEEYVASDDSNNSKAKPAYRINNNTKEVTTDFKIENISTPYSNDEIISEPTSSYTNNKSITIHKDSRNKGSNTSSNKKSISSSGVAARSTDLLISLSKLNIFNPKALEYKRDIIYINNPFPSPIPEPAFVLSTTFNVGLGISIWDYNLNDNYTSALSPADFTHTSGTSNILQLGVEKRSSQLISFRANISFEEVSFQSGHNSNILYRPSDENADNENNFGLDMATPLGGVNTNIAVRRNQNNTGNQESLTIELHNQHNYKNVDISLSILQHLYDNGPFNFNTEIGLGLNHMFNVRNNLSRVDISNSAYSIASIDASSTQTDLNKTRAHMILGINAGISVYDNVDVSFAYLFKNDFSPIFNSGDFSTTLTRHQFVVSAKRRF